LVLLLAQQNLESMLPANVLRSLEPLLLEARKRLDPYSGSRPLKDWPSKVAVVSQLQPLLPPKLQEGIFDEVTIALQSDCWLDIDYRNLEGETLTNRRVMPLALVQQGARLFLVCQFEGYSDNRHLALHRLLRAKATPHPFNRPTFNLTQYIHMGRFGFGNGQSIQLKLDISSMVANLLEETPVSIDQVIVPTSADRFILTATVVLSEQLRWWLRTYGTAIVVVEPKNLLIEQPN
jgi:predicted DNA-binding transcriptional regulator YafY